MGKKRLVSKINNRSNIESKIIRGLASLILLEDRDGNILPSDNSSIGNLLSKNVEYQANYPYSLSDPRILFIKKIVEIFLSRYTLINDNKVIAPFAFRLKKLSDWLVKTDINNFLSQMAWACKTSCIFCYQKGNPPFMKIKKKLSLEEIETRLRCFDPIKKLGLVAGERFDNDEILNNPYITKIFKNIRKKEKGKKSLISILTNGVSLTPKMIKFLANFKPILLGILLNSASPIWRKKMMHDPRPETAINSLPLLRKYKIPFIINIVAWPGLPFYDIENTIRYAEKNEAHMIHLFLPGYSKFFPMKKKVNMHKHWKKNKNHFYPFTRKILTPLIIFPTQIHHTPKVMGTIINSPAYLSGIKPGDIIKKINQKPVESIEETMVLLKQNLRSKIRIHFQRNKDVFELIIKDSPKNCYPYSSIVELQRSNPFGFVFLETYVPQDDINDIALYILLHNAKKVMIIASRKAKQLILHLINKLNVPSEYGVEIKIVYPQDIFFGGNIDTGNLFVVNDFIKAIKNGLKKFKSDLIIIPANPFNNWSRDITGQICLNIEREIKIPVELIYNKSIELASIS